MNTPRSSEDTSRDIRALFVGPESWQRLVRKEIEEARALSAQFVANGERARTALVRESGSIDCVVGAFRLADYDGLELADEVRSCDGSVPFVLAPVDGSESLARRAVSADIAEYVPLSADERGGALERCLRRAVRNRRARTRSRQFDALFSDPSRLAFVLDADGTVVRPNRTALHRLDLDERDIAGRRLWALPLFEGEAARRDVQSAVRRGKRGEHTEFEAEFADSSVETRIEFSVHPVTDDGGDVGRLVVEGTEVEERARLEEELERSEELHRVTLNNMTDTILITDDDGKFTYVCPNVHFIFGYTAEDIYEFETIDALLGDDLFDPDRLEAKNVLTNIECTAVDQSGTEHTLLVNVRNVSIQGGTRLYSCRDITKRKQREEALTQLHQTTRSLLYAETKPEIAEQVVTDTASVLPPATSAVYLFDREQNVLYPTAAGDELTRAIGDLPELSLDQSSVISRSFVEDETLVDENARSPLWGASSPGVEDYIVVPLGEHGIFLLAAVDSAAFDAVSEEVAELLAATAEAAFDRVERDGDLHERDKELQRRNQQLSQVNQVNEIIREIDQALVRADTRTDIEQAVCERLTANDRFSFAWIAETRALNRTLHPRAWAGNERGYLDGVRLNLDAEGTAVEPTIRTAREGKTTRVSNVADHLRTDAWCKQAVSRDFQSVLAIPLVYDDVQLGTLSVYADHPDAFDEMVRSVLCELGETVASAINAVQRKEALRSDSAVELEYRITDSSAVLYRLAEAARCTIEVEGEVAKDEGTTLVFATVEGTSPRDVVDKVDEFVGITSAKTIRETADGGLVNLQVNGHFIASALTDHGAVFRNLRATPDGIRLVVDVPDSITTREIDEVVSNSYDSAELTAQRTHSQAADRTERRGWFDGELTERQLEVATVAYHSGYFDSSRDVTGRDVASMLGISHTAFYDHVRRIQRKLFASLIERSVQSRTVE